MAQEAPRAFLALIGNLIPRPVEGAAEGPVTILVNTGIDREPADDLEALGATTSRQFESR